MYLTVNDAKVFAGGDVRPFDAGKPSVVFVHGAGMDQTVWALQSRYFGYHGYNALAVNLPGHGRAGNRSEGEPLASIDAIGDWLVHLMDAAGIERGLLVGHSMGALGVMACAARHEDRVARLALLGAAEAMPVHPALLKAAKNGEGLSQELVTAWGFGPSGHIGGNRTPGAWMMGSGLQLLAAAAEGLLYNDLAACNAFDRGTAYAEAVDCPTLILAGALDKMTPAKMGARLAGMMPWGDFIEISDCGHMMMIEKPDETLGALKGFFAGASVLP